MTTTRKMNPMAHKKKKTNNNDRSEEKVSIDKEIKILSTLPSHHPCCDNTTMKVIHKFLLINTTLCLLYSPAVSGVSHTPDLAPDEEYSTPRFLRRHGNHINRDYTPTRDEKFNDQNSLRMEKGEDLYFQKLVKRMKPHFLQVNTIDDNNASLPMSSSSLNIDAIQSVGPPYNPPVKQFYHLHHMKTGGTSLEYHISCALRRYSQFYNYIQNDLKGDAEDTTTKPPRTYLYQENSSMNNNLRFPTYKLSECSPQTYTNCVTGPSNSTCHDRISNSAVMTYCASLAITRHFGWNDDSFQTPSVTMLRHPVNRVWSMYRFQTKNCYSCKSLKEVYEDIDNGNTSGYGSGVCIPQIVNHFTRNLLTNLTVDELNGYASQMTEAQMVRDAIHSIKYRFTVVGIIERLEESLKLFSYSFPWLSEDFYDNEYYSETQEYYEKYKNTLRKCEFPHANASPSNNGCGENHSHMKLPSQPDEETRKIIEEHNKMDIQVYEAALEHFEMQKRAMEYEEEEDMER